MTEAQLKSLIDYYLTNQPIGWATWIYGAALLLSIIALLVSLEQLRTSSRHHVRGEWNSLMDICIENPQFIDINFTNNYNRTDDPGLVRKYEAFCYKA